jgi:CO dehydrogenase/acetyl-CoA synthase gamma subunit (corrinoid Fe-S protein)
MLKYGRSPVTVTGELEPMSYAAQPRNSIVIGKDKKAVTMGGARAIAAYHSSFPNSTSLVLTTATSGTTGSKSNKISQNQRRHLKTTAC